MGKPTASAKKTVERLSMSGLLSDLPPTQTIEYFEEVSKVDPLTWSMFFRRLKGVPARYDMLKEVRQARRECRDEQTRIGELTPRTQQKFLRMLRAHRPFLIQPLCDVHPFKVYMKGRQVGVSELEITEVLQFLSSHEGTKWVYAFPRDTQLRDFSQTRINETKQETPRLSRIFGVPDGIYSKQIIPIGSSPDTKRSFLLLRSSWDATLGEGVDADGLTLDEKDRMKDGIEVAFKESLSASPWGWRREVSTPTIPNRGVSATFEESDQHCWLVRCKKCNTWQEILYPDNIIELRELEPGMTRYPEGSFDYACKRLKCRGKLDRMRGKWVPKFPMRKEIRGYHMPQTVAPWITATALMNKKLEYKLKQLFENYVLARTSLGETKLTQEEDYEKCCAGHDLIYTRDTSVWERVSVGIDWGGSNWYIVLGMNSENHLPYILNWGFKDDREADPLGSAKDIATEVAPMIPDIVVADAGYGKDRNAHMLQMFGQGIFYACNYNTSDKTSRQIVPTWQENAVKVIVDRTMCLKRAMQAIRDHQIGLPTWGQMGTYFQKHCLNLVPLVVEDTDEAGKSEFYETIQSKGPDHFAHALGYALLGMDKLYSGSGSNFQADFVGPGES